MELKYEVLITEMERTGPDIIRFRTQRPVPFPVTPGNAVLIGIPGSSCEPGPFSPVGGPLDLYLEFFIKIYRSHDGLTEGLEQCEAGDALQISEAFGSIEYKGAGHFLAAGTGITPFLAIFRQLEAQGSLEGNRLYYTETTRAEAIQEREFREMLGDNVEIILTEEGDDRLDGDYLRKKINDPAGSKFYICGPPDFVDEMKEAAMNLGATEDAIIIETEA